MQQVHYRARTAGKTIELVLAEYEATYGRPWPHGPELAGEHYREAANENEWRNAGTKLTPAGIRTAAVQAMREDHDFAPAH